jgi:hypothetical protein
LFPVLLQAACASVPRPVVIAPADVRVSGDGVDAVSPEHTNIATLSGLGLPYSERDITLTCGDGRTEHVSIRNDGLLPGLLLADAGFATAAAVFFWSAATTDDLSTRASSLGYGAGISATVLVTLATFWQPSQPVTVVDPHTACSSTSAAAAHGP